MSSKSGADDKHRERVCAEVRECGFICMGTFMDCLGFVWGGQGLED